MEKQTDCKPVAWLDSDGFPWSLEGVECRSTPDTYQPLYTRPQQPLSEEQLGLLTTHPQWSHIETSLLAAFARAVEAAHGIKKEAV